MMEEDFNKFWIMYPKKVARKDAARAWIKLNPSPELVKMILAAIEKQKQSRQWATIDYIPFPATWLNGERWLDELEPKEKLWFEKE